MILRYTDFVAVCIAAKDCTAPPYCVIEGTEGYITAELPPNRIGKVTLKRHGEEAKEYEDNMAEKRVIPEFRYFIQCMKEGRMQDCLAGLDRSIAVSRVQTEARLDAGIVFRADRGPTVLS